MSYQPYNSVPVTPITMLKTHVPDYEAIDEGYEAPRAFARRRAPEMYSPVGAPPPQIPQRAVALAKDVTAAATSEYHWLKCDLRHIKYLLMAIVALFLLILIFKR